MTPRRLVGTTNSSSCALPGASGGRVKRAAVMPTGSSTSSGSMGPARLVGDRDAPGGRVAHGHAHRVDLGADGAPGCGRPPAARRRARGPGPRPRSSATRPSRAGRPTTQPVTPSTSTAQPSGETQRSTPATGCHTGRVAARSASVRSASTPPARAPASRGARGRLGRGTLMAGSDGSRPPWATGRRGRGSPGARLAPPGALEVGAPGRVLGLWGCGPAHAQATRSAGGRPRRGSGR